MTIIHDLMTRFNLRSIIYNKEKIMYTSIHSFNVSIKGLNDKNNKTRENIIGAIINDKIPNEYYIIATWKRLKKNIFSYIHQLNINAEPYIKIECLHKGGRKFNYDFNIIMYYDDKTHYDCNIELKFNATKVEETPQFVSPMKPSQYMNNSYEDYYYNNYLQKLSTMAGLPLPSKEEYLSQIHSNKPKCMKVYQELYYQGCALSSKYTKQETDIQFYELSKNVSNESITNFINNTDLNIALLSTYLHNTQQDKIYMLYSNGTFTMSSVNMDDYKIESVIKNADKFRYECISKSGKKINVLLRWKNGNGIAFPAFQIS
jgi:hypothetical protein